MRYLRFHVVFDFDGATGADTGWKVRSDRLSIEDQMTPYPTRRAAVCAMREIAETEWARHLFEVDGP